MKKQPASVSPDKLENIECALDRIACSLASISGIMDNIFIEIMKEKKQEQPVSSDTDMLAKRSDDLNEPSFEHDRK